MKDQTLRNNELDARLRVWSVTWTTSTLALLMASFTCFGCDNLEDNPNSNDGSQREYCRDNNDCLRGDICVNHECVRGSSACSDSDACQTGFVCDEQGQCIEPDVSVDNDVDEPDAIDDVACPTPQDCPDADDPLAEPTDLPTAEITVDPIQETTEPDECEGREDGRFGESCSGASSCCNGLCLGNVDEGEGFCTEPCIVWDDCNPVGRAGDYFCLTVADGRFCAVDDYLDPCSGAAQCSGQLCLLGAGISGCSWFCSSSADCQPGVACGYIGTDAGLALACVPIGSTCSVSNNCLSGTCLVDDVTGAGYCSVFCEPSDPQPCPTGFRCETVEPEYPPLCVL